jgi:hypothetical protein
MSFQWSFSTDKLFRRCQRQFFFREIAAHHAPKEPWRREAFILKQLKTLELWRGTVIHEGIQKYVVPALKNGEVLDWRRFTEQTLHRAKEQFLFSERRRYREPEITKGKYDSFCALIPHETGEGVSRDDFEEVCDGIKTAFQRLSTLTELWEGIRGCRDCQAEMPLWLKFDDVSIKVQIDLFFQRTPRHPTIIDWKSYELGGDTDARLQTTLYGWAVWRCGRYEVRRPEDIDLLECQVQDGVVIEHTCSQAAFDELEDHIYRSLHRIFTLSQSKKLAEANLQDFAFTDNPNNCEHCTFRALCIQRATASSARSVERPLADQTPSVRLQSSSS